MKRLLSALCSLCLLSTSLTAQAQETPAPAASDAPSAATRLDGEMTEVRTQPLLSPREENRFAVLGELGWNGLSGLGVVGVFHANPHLSFDLGSGISGAGYKFGGRARFNFLKGSWTPLLGAGAIYATGSLGEFNFDGDLGDVRLKLKPAVFIQGVAGVEYTPARNGFTFLATAGYAHQLAENIQRISGVATPTEEDAMKLAYHGGAVVSVALGYAF